MRNERGSVSLLIIVIFACSVIAFGIWRYLDTKSAHTPPPNPDPEVNQSAQQIPTGFLMYEHKGAGFSFAYPQSWGEVQIKDFDSPSKGETNLYGVFTKNSSVTFGGDRKDYSHDGRGLAPTDHPGYVKQGAKYFTYSGFGQTGDLAEIKNAASLEEIKASNTTGLYQKKALIGDEYDSRKNYDIVRFNLTKSPYFGVNLVLNIDEASDTVRQDFLKAAQTFKLL